MQLKMVVKNGCKHLLWNHMPCILDDLLFFTFLFSQIKGIHMYILKAAASATVGFIATSPVAAVKVTKQEKAIKLRRLSF